MPMTKQILILWFREQCDHAFYLIHNLQELFLSHFKRQSYRSH